MNMRDRLAGKVVLVAGASTGIGRATALCLPSEGTALLASTDGEWINGRCLTVEGGMLLSR